MSHDLCVSRSLCLSQGLSVCLKVCSVSRSVRLKVCLFDSRSVVSQGLCVLRSVCVSQGL